MFSVPFSHYLSYGATDQRTARDLTGEYTGLLVPGTIAAFQREGTGGFVLTLSATVEAPDYAIDPRFPLFQQRLARPNAKQSHVALATLLGSPQLIRASDPSPADFTQQLIQTVAENWAIFNGAYQAAAGSKFTKYARRLNQPVIPQNAKGPRQVLPPYLVAHDSTDPWWAVSVQLFEATLAATGDADRCVRVIASHTPNGLANLIEGTSDERFAIWVSGLEELNSSAADLAAYGRAISAANDADRRPFALYGGFFSVLMRAVGLAGSSHGIGYGEYRNWIELPDSGPPPARYYLPQLHRYIQPDEAARLYFADPRLAACQCLECNGDPPLGLDYHALMKHSVRCRAMEITSWAGQTPAQAADRLLKELRIFRQILQATTLPEIAIARAERAASHIETWAAALRAI